MSKAQPNDELASEIASANNELNPNLNLVLMRLVLGNLVSEVIHVAVKLDLAGLLSNQPRTDQELAEATGTKVAALYRMLRVLGSVGILKETTPTISA